MVWLTRRLIHFLIVAWGVTTLVFALSTNLWLSLLALVILGGADSISVFVRQSLVQIVTPDHMRGRVAAVSGLFISASNELGEFESGEKEDDREKVEEKLHEDSLGK